MGTKNGGDVWSFSASNRLFENKPLKSYNVFISTLVSLQSYIFDYNCFNGKVAVLEMDTKTPIVS